MLIREVPGLAEEFINSLESSGYTSLYPPQEEAVKSGVLEGENLVLATPTASGKTLVAMVAAQRTISKGGKVVYLSPLRALASEKLGEFRKAFSNVKKNSKSGVKVLISTGDYDSSGENLGRGDIIVLTNERFDSILRHGATWVDQIGLFIADEIHLVGESRRGATLEMILAKVMRYTPGAQILALSATISNAEELAKWLGAKLISTEWRPTELVEGVYDGGVLSFVGGESTKLAQTNRGSSIDVAIDTVRGLGQSLIFCETRKRAVATAEKAAEIVPTLLSSKDTSELRDVAARIRNSSEETDVSRRLANVVENGVAFHHAGLDSRHREIVEEAFKSRAIKILTATPTLASGVNLPARRVVLSSVMRYNVEEGGQEPISVLEFKQMAGRAGRPLYDKVGEIVLLANQGMNSEELLEHYINGEVEPIRSQLSSEGALRSALLGLIAAKSGIRESEVYDFFESTLFGLQYRETTIHSRVKKALDFLQEEELIFPRTRKFLATRFGKRVAMLYIDPQSATIMRRAISKAESRENHTLGLLHVIVKTPDMSPKFGTRQKDIAEVNEILATRHSEFIIPIPSPEERAFYSDDDDPLSNFRTVLALNAWMNENPEQFILEKYSIEPGDLHRMVENANWLLYSMGELSKLFGRLDLASEYEELRERVRYGIKMELIFLTRLEAIGRVRARSLFNAGFTTIEKLAAAPAETLAQVPKIGNSVALQIKQQLQ